MSKKLGRPFAEGSPRDHRLTIAMTADDHTIITEAAYKRREDVSGFMRDAVIKKAMRILSK